MPDSVPPFILRQTDESKGFWPFFNIQVGSGLFSVSVDTHSPITWLYSKTVPESSRGRRNVYDPRPDIPFANQGNLSITFGDGLEVTFQKAFLDKIGFGETSQEGQVVFGASSVKGQKGIANSHLMDGILALQPQYGAGSSGLTFWAKLAPNLPKPVFVADLTFNGIGEYTFGTIPYKPTEIQFWKGWDKNLWRLPITKFTIGEARGRAKASGAGFHATLDTACSSLRLPSDIVQTYYSMVPGHIYQDGVHLIPPFDVLPDLYLYIGKRNYEVKIPGAFLKPQGSNDHGYLYKGRLEESTDPHGAILGHPFFFAANVIFEGNDNLSVGLVRKDARKLEA